MRVVLEREGVKLPRNTIHRILLRHDLVREEERRAPATQRFERAQPNELWQMDFKGTQGMAAPGGAAVGARRSQSLSNCSGGQRQHARCTGAGAVGGGLAALRSSGRDVDGSRDTLVESEVALGTNPSVAVADAARNPAALERLSASPDPGQGGALSRIATACSATAWLAARANTNLAGCVSLGAQPCASARSPGDADTGHSLATQSTALRSASAALGVSVRGLGVEARLPWTGGYPGTKVESQ